jgi:hypothetical protein
VIALNLILPDEIDKMRAPSTRRSLPDDAEFPDPHGAQSARRSHPDFPARSEKQTKTQRNKPMQAIIKSSWKHVLFALLVFGFISSASTAPKKERPAAGARKEGKALSAEKSKKRTAKKKTQHEAGGAAQTTNETNNEILEHQKEGAEESAEAAE